MENRIGWRNLLLIIGVPVLLALGWFTLMKPEPETEIIYSDVLKFFDPDEAESGYIEKYDLSMEKRILTITFNENGQKAMEGKPNVNKDGDMRKYVTWRGCPQGERGKRI